MSESHITITCNACGASLTSTLSDALDWDTQHQAKHVEGNVHVK